jgi:Domain of unknown function (DUF1918)
MRADTGDWFIVKGPSDIGAARRAIVLEAQGPEGSAPILLRWIAAATRPWFPGTGCGNRDRGGTIRAGPRNWPQQSHQRPSWLTEGHIVIQL